VDVDGSNGGSTSQDEEARQEGSEYNEYVKFMQYWEPRLFPHGNFQVYFEQERNQYLFGGSSALAIGNSDAWQEIGPIEKPISSNSAAGIGPTEFITFYEAAPSRMLCGSNAGGLFYSVNGGVTWSKAGTDTQIGRSGVGTAVFHPSDYMTWFAASGGNSGTGEPLWIGFTGGVFRTIDEGATWTQIATQAQLDGVWNRIFKLLINPLDAHQLWVATAYGVYVTTNALDPNPIWMSIPALSGKYVYDLEIRPGDSNWLYATVSDTNDANGAPTAWHYMYSSNNGSTWFDVPGQDPSNTPTAGKLTIEVSPAAVNRLYCQTIAPGGNAVLYTYDFSSGVWTTAYTSAHIKMGGGNSFGVDPFNPNEVFLSEGTEGRRYTYGSPTTYITYNSAYSGGTYHPDIEDLVPHPTNQDEVWMCHHGGVAQSLNNGVTWVDRSTGLGVAQTTRMYESESDASYVSLGLYHDGTVVTNATWSDPWSPTWRVSCGGDGMRPLIDHQTAKYQWCSNQFGYWSLSSDFGVNFFGNNPISPVWIVEAAFNKLDSRTQYRVVDGGHHEISRTFDRFANKSLISNFQALYSGPTVDHYILWKVFTPETNADHLIVHLRAYYINGTIPPEEDHLYRTTIANNSVASNVIASWQELPLPRNAWVGDVDFDLANPNIVYIAYSSSSAQSVSTTGSEMVFKVDYTNPALMLPLYSCPASVCSDLTQNLPNGGGGGDGLVVERGTNGGLYYVGDYGMWHSDKASLSTLNGWSKLGSGLPNTSYNGAMINYRANKIRVASFGRGAWEHDLWCPSLFSSVESGTYSIDRYLEVNQSIASTAAVPASRNVTYRAGDSIDLQPGFRALPGSIFEAFIHPCDRPYNSPL